MESLDLQGVFAALLLGEKKVVMTLAKEPVAKPFAMDYLKNTICRPGACKKV